MHEVGIAQLLRRKGGTTPKICKIMLMRCKQTVILLIVFPPGSSEKFEFRRMDSSIWHTEQYMKVVIVPAPDSGVGEAGLCGVAPVAELILRPCLTDCQVFRCCGWT